MFHRPTDGVINEWDGEGIRDEENGHVPNPGKGMREALLIAAEQVLDTTDHGVVTGKAPAGTVLHITKDFKTATGRVCQVIVAPPVGFANPPLSELTGGRCVGETDPILFDDKVDTKMTVGDSGQFAYHVNPSTRPFAEKEESFKLSCGKDSRSVVVGRGKTVDVGSICAGEAEPGCSDTLAPKSVITSVQVRQVP